MAFPTGWTQRAPLVIQASQVPGSTALVNLPVLLTADTIPAALLASATYQTDGGDIRFTTDEAGTTEIACEIVSLSMTSNGSGATCEIWVKVPSVSATVDTTIYIWRNSAGGQSAHAVTDTYGRNAVWTDFVAVFHGDSTTDATGNGNTLTQEGTGTATGYTTQAKVGKAFNLPGTGSLTANMNALDAVAKVVAYCWARSTATTTFRPILGKTDYAEPPQGWFLQQSSPDTRIEQMSPAGRWAYANNQLAQNTWVHLVMQGDSALSAGAQELYTNGSKVSYAEAEGTGAANTDTASIFRIAGRSGGYWTGQVDEVRLRTGTWFSADRIAAEYANQNSPGTFVVEGSVSDVSGSPANGSLAVTLGDDTLAAGGKVKANGAASIALSDDTLAADGKVKTNGALAVTLDDTTMSGAGPGAVSRGTLTLTLEDVTLTAEGVAIVQGYGLPPIDDVELTATAEAGSGGFLDVALEDTTVASAGTVKANGALDITIGDTTLAANGRVLNIASLNVTLNDDTLSASGTAPVKGALSAALGDATLVATAIKPGTDSILQVTLDDVQLTSAGKAPARGYFEIVLDDIELLSAGKARIGGAASVPIEGTTVAAAGKVKTNGALTITLGDTTVASAAKVRTNGALSVLLADTTLAAVGFAKTPAIGNLAQSIDNTTLTATAHAVVKGTLTITLADTLLLGDIAIPAEANSQRIARARHEPRVGRAFHASRVARARRR